MKYPKNTNKKIPASDEAERGRIHMHADTVREISDLVHWPRLLSKETGGHDGNPNWN